MKAKKLLWTGSLRLVAFWKTQLNSVQFNKFICRYKLHVQRDVRKQHRHSFKLGEKPFQAISGDSQHWKIEIKCLIELRWLYLASGYNLQVYKTENIRNSGTCRYHHVFLIRFQPRLHHEIYYIVLLCTLCFLHWWILKRTFSAK